LLSKGPTKKEKKMFEEKYSASAPHSQSIDSKHRRATPDTDMSLLYPNLSRPTFSEKDPDKNNLDIELELEEDDEDSVDSGHQKDELFDTPR
jgi:hypothetical protein